MSNVRYINGWECSICFELYQTERKAKNCLKRCISDRIKNNESYDDEEVNFLNGYECIDCLTIHKKKKDAKICCNVKYPEEEDDCNYDKVSFPKAYLLTDIKKHYEELGEEYNDE